MKLSTEELEDDSYEKRRAERRGDSCKFQPHGSNPLKGSDSSQLQL